MSVYSLTNIDDLENDLNDIVNRISSIYQIEFIGDKIIISPNLLDESNVFWAAEENTIEFNKHIPKFKSLHKDMYSFIETIVRNRKGTYNYLDFEREYENFKEFRLLNNTFKHNEKKQVEIYFSKIVIIDNQQKFELLCNFKDNNGDNCLVYSLFVKLFLTILVDLKAISIKN
jgi:hypothetical protein